MSSTVKSEGSNSSQIKPKVSSEASLISIVSWVAFEQRFGINSNHSFLGISIAAIIAIALPTYFLTEEEWVARVESNPSLSCSLNC